MMIGADQLDQRVTLQTSAITRDAVGGQGETWSDTVTVWAGIRPLSARQIALAQQTGAVVAKAITIRWRSGLASSQRVKFADGRVAKVAWLEEFPIDGRAVLMVESVDG